MSSPQEGPNPLRPYYRPPSVGLPLDETTNVSSTRGIGGRHTAAAATVKPSFGTSARDILSDLDCSDYLSDASPSATAVVKALVDQALWKYSSVLLAQPFEVAKTVLQVQHGDAMEERSAHAAQNEDMRRRPEKYRHDDYEVSSDDSDPDSPSYFTSAAPLSHTPSRSPRPRRHRHHRGRSFTESPPRTPKTPPISHYPHSSPHTHQLASRSSVSSTLSHLWSTEGAWGIWKGTNSTFIHSVLFSTITSFARSLLCAILALPDPGLSFPQSQPPYLIPMPSAIGGLDILSSPSPLASLIAAVSAAGIAGIILAPLDTVRTKLMLTPSTHPPRSLIPTLQSLPSWSLPFSIAPVTLLHSTLPTLISACTPLFLRSRLGIDPVLTPNLYAIATFLSQTLELGVRLPLETVLRRGQIAIFTASPSPPSRSFLTLHQPQSNTSPPFQTTVEVGPYKGLGGTIYHIVFEEGSCNEGGASSGPEIVSGTGGAPALKTGTSGKKRKGQGLEGLWRGWRVGMWGLVGVWGAAIVGGGGAKGGEF